MDVVFLALADYVNVSKEGKLNILGVFDQINPPTPLPYRHPMMSLAATFSAGPAEFDTMCPIRIVLTDEDGAKLFEVNGELKIGRPLRPGARFNYSQVIGLANVQFKKAGAYQFTVLSGHAELRTLTVYVNEGPQPSAQLQAGGN